MILEINKLLRWFENKLPGISSKTEELINEKPENNDADKTTNDNNINCTKKEVKAKQIIYNQFANMKLGPSLVVLGIRTVCDENVPDKGWASFADTLIELGFFIDNKAELEGIYEISDNILSKRGISATVLEFSPTSKLNESMRKERNKNYILWPDEFKKECSHWYLSGNI